MSWCILISIIFKRIMLSQSQSNRFLYRTFQKLLLLVIVCVFIFWQHGRHLGPLQWKKGVLTTGPPGNPSKALNMLICMVNAPEEYVCVCVCVSLNYLKSLFQRSRTIEEWQSHVAQPEYSALSICLTTDLLWGNFCNIVVLRTPFGSHCFKYLM